MDAHISYSVTIQFSYAEFMTLIDKLNAGEGPSETPDQAKLVGELNNVMNSIRKIRL